MVNEQEELKRLKEMLLKIKKKHEIDVQNNNEQEMEKNKRVMILLLDKIKEKKKAIDLQKEMASLSEKVQIDIKDHKNFFAKKSHRKTKLKIHIPTLVSFIIVSLYSIVCILQFHFYDIRLYQKTTEGYEKAIYNLNYMAKFIGVIILLYFFIYCVNYKNMKYKLLIVSSGMLGLVFGILSYGGIGKLNDGFFSGELWGVVPGIVLVLCAVFLFKNIRVIKTTKRKSLKESSEYKIVDSDPDEEKIKQMLKLEKLKEKSGKK